MKIDFSTILDSTDFQQDLEDYLTFAANIKLERFIAYSIAKQFQKANISAVLEKNKTDIVLDNKINVELKYNFDLDLHKLSQELRKCPSKDLMYIWEAGNKTTESTIKISKTWSVSYGILKDIIEKKCDYFIWIICERDYNSYMEVLKSENNVCAGKFWKQNFQKEKTINLDLDDFNQKLKNTRLYNSYLHKRIEFKKPYITNLHFHVYSFQGN